MSDIKTSDKYEPAKYSLVTITIEDQQFTNCMEETLSWLMYNLLPTVSPFKCRYSWIDYLYAIPGFAYKKMTKSGRPVELLATLENLWHFFRRVCQWEVFCVDDLKKYCPKWSFELLRFPSSFTTNDTVMLYYDSKLYSHSITITQQFDIAGKRVTGHIQVVNNNEETKITSNKLTLSNIANLL